MRERRRVVTIGRVAAGLAACLLVLAPAAAGEKERRLPGFVDGSEFVELARKDADLVEIAIHKALLGALCKGWSREGESAVGQLLCQLDWIGAVIVDVSDAPERVASLIRAKESELLRGGWERLARIREGGSNVSVLTLSRNEKITGLAVIAHEKGEVVFTNIAGVLDLALIGQLGAKMSIPGLDHVAKPEDE